jgi:tripartite-type tricarboxylate transporter receptor subunit TctC
MAVALVFVLVFVLGLAAPDVAAAQSADDYPQRNVTFLCPFPAGGGTDILTRILAAELQDKLKRTVIVENRPGGGTIVAAQAAARAAPDGHTIFLAPVTTLALGPNIYKTLPYDTVKDFAPIGLVGSSQFALVANPKLDIAALATPDLNRGSGQRGNSTSALAELIALIKSKDGQLSYATSGASTPHHLFMEMFLTMIGAKAQHVPYRGSVAALTDVISGQIPFMIVDLAVALPAIKEGKVKIYGVTSTERIKALPEVPTIAEAGVPGYGGTPWFSVVAPAGTPRPIIDKLNRTLMTFISRPETQDKMNALAITPWTSTPDELARFIPAEIKKWAQVVKDAGITPE